MTEKKSSTNSSNTNDTSPVDETKPLNKISEKPTVAPEKLANKVTSNVEKKPMSSATKTATVNKVSKIGVLAFLLSLIALGGIGGGYFWYLQQQQLASDNLRTQTQQQVSSEIQTSQQQLVGQLSGQIQQQKQILENAVKGYLEQQSEAQQAKIDAVAKQVSELSVNKPSDWLAQESEYLIRLAARTLWLEQDVSTAINLLRDADTRLAELKNPQYISVRKAIHQDIEALNLLPKVDTETVVLTLMGLSQQINQLPIAMVHLPESSEEKTAVTVSDNAADWQSNLAIIWQDFLDKFFTVSRRTSSVEALLTPDQQQNLRQNLSLKLQMSQWAVTQQSTSVYQQALQDVEQWLVGYFDLDTVVVQQFIDSVTQLKNNTITMPEMSELTSLPQIRQILEKQNRVKQPATVITKEIEQSVSNEDAAQEQQNQPDNKEPLL